MQLLLAHGSWRLVCFLDRLRCVQFSGCQRQKGNCLELGGPCRCTDVPTGWHRCLSQMQLMLGIWPLRFHLIQSAPFTLKSTGTQDPTVSAADSSPGVITCQTWVHLCASGIQCLPAGLRRFLAGEGMSSSLSLLAAFFLLFLLCLLAPPVLAAGAAGASEGATSAGSPASRQALLKAASTESHISLQGGRM